VEGYFNTSLPAAKHKFTKFSIIRLDGDTYESTWDAISVLYPFLSSGGYVIVDDYISWDGCRKAIDDYRNQNGIHSPIYNVFHAQGEIVAGVYWKKE
jgi:hypothetical protein